MILSALRLFRSLTGYHYKMIILTILLPVIGFPIIDYFGPDLCVVRVILYVAAFSVWSVSAVLAVASMLRSDSSKAEQQTNQKLEALSDQICRLRAEHKESRVDLRQQVDDLEEVVRSTFEDLGVVLPPRPVSVGAKAINWTVSVSAANVTVGGSKLARLRQWFRRAMRRSWEVTYGKPEDS